ncbi:MBL fold metallo-hydrolase [Chloroflexota bacterium]
MKLVVLGSNGYRPNDLGHTACYTIPELGLILDAGTGIYRMADYLQTPQLDVYLSHDHHDHTYGMVYLVFLFWRKLARDAIARGDKASLASIAQSMHVSPPTVRVHAAEEHLPSVQDPVGKSHSHVLMEYVPLQAAEQLPGGGQLTSFPVEHFKDQLCFGYRLDHPGGSLAYVTDTYGEPGASYVDKIRGVDVLLHDCFFPDDEEEFARRFGHSHSTPVAQLAAEAGVGRLVLIHLNALRPELGEPELDRAQSIFPRTEVAFDRMEIEF